ncbi:MAG: hypothetical protein AAB800_03565 [Patescibacteria group bacterium]
MFDETRHIHDSLANSDPDLDWFLKKTLDINHREAQLAGGGFHEKKANEAWDIVKLLSKDLDTLNKDERWQTQSFIRDNFGSSVQMMDLELKSGDPAVGRPNFDRYCRVLNKLAGLSL